MKMMLTFDWLIDKLNKSIKSNIYSYDFDPESRRIIVTMNMIAFALVLHLKEFDYIYFLCFRKSQLDAVNCSNIWLMRFNKLLNQSFYYKSMNFYELFETIRFLFLSGELSRVVGGVICHDYSRSIESITLYRYDHNCCHLIFSF